MKLSRAALALSLYRAVGTVAYPLAGPYVSWRASRGKEESARRRERYGYSATARPEGVPLVWIHAASVGETAAVAPMVQRLIDDDFAVLMTTGTVTSAAMVRERLSPSVLHQYVPLDFRPSVARFLDHWRPDLAIVAESEIWPVTISELGRRSIPQILVNARLSDRSFRRWKKLPSLAEALLENLSQVVAQSDIDGQRFSLLGAPAVKVAGNLKADVPPPAADPEELARLKAAIGERPIWAALSTHSGEERLAAKIHESLKARHGGLLTLIVPRHVNRAGDLERELAQRGLKVVRRSSGALPAPDTDIYLGDTMGEMGLYLRLTEIAFMGKSLSAQGGQNPLEAAMLGTAILSGCNVQNFREGYQRLADAGAARLVKDEASLSDQVDCLLSQPQTRRKMIAAGGETIAGMRGAFGRTMEALDPFLRPLKLSFTLGGRDRLSGGK
ncbi:lipid IV(A) 3-deoxy-D-manno-octulosonic acid transferase [Consotaella salsifontis]|uniref:3-deoxy-D-manno-octulosonic acid transferase n=1 Tax=Consotaella salsifontis TaxID=1365950 RepID=A0A1T4PYK1_9HYPH|nr:lipid IV(A) 3-deoxy-D-manno-octulosonic acid transferase [Consotaella salsifontis]SJZ96406.1 3-deoxy-D-manno-octulosonic-acid transferase [Consotaella salsifontis]